MRTWLLDTEGSPEWLQGFQLLKHEDDQVTFYKPRPVYHPLRNLSQDAEARRVRHMLETLRTPEKRLAASKRSKRIHAEKTPEKAAVWTQRQSRSNKVAWSCPERRQKMAEIKREWWARRKRDSTE